MPRIRTIKPEFWDSPSTARASAVARLAFIGMWNWADDHGRGTANLKELEGFIFPNDDVSALSRGTSENFRDVVAEVSDCFGVVLYKVDGRPYYAIPSWERHQRNEKRAKSKFPGPEQADPHDFNDSGGSSGNARNFRDSAAETPRSSGTGTGEQGNRGTGEQGSSEPTVPGDASAAATEADETAQTIIADWLDTLSQRPPGRVIGHLSKEVKNLLDEGQDFEQVRAAVHEWNRRGLHPSTLPSVLHSLRNEQPRLSAADRRRAASIDRHNRLSNYTPPMEDPFGNVTTIEPQKEIAQ